MMAMIISPEKFPSRRGRRLHDAPRGGRCGDRDGIARDGGGSSSEKGGSSVVIAVVVNRGR
jgi:hypothetical protein